MMLAKVMVIPILNLNNLKYHESIKKPKLCNNNTEQVTAGLQFGQVNEEKELEEYPTGA